MARAARTPTQTPSVCRMPMAAVHRHCTAHRATCLCTLFGYIHVCLTLIRFIYVHCLRMFIQQQRRKKGAGKLEARIDGPS